MVHWANHQEAAYASWPDSERPICVWIIVSGQWFYLSPATVARYIGVDKPVIHIYTPHIDPYRIMRAITRASHLIAVNPDVIKYCQAKDILAIYVPSQVQVYTSALYSVDVVGEAILGGDFSDGY